MAKQATSSGRMRQLNQRQLKKLRLGEFKELIFVINVAFKNPMDAPAYEPLLDDFIDFIESRKLLVGGMGGTLPLTETEGMVQKDGRGSPTEEDRQAVLAWLQARPEIATATAGELVDGWYGWN